jgi:hypothetical protein
VGVVDDVLVDVPTVSVQPNNRRVLRRRMVEK